MEKIGVNALTGLYLIATGKNRLPRRQDFTSVNALTGLYLIATTYYKDEFNLNKSVSMPSRAYTSLLQYPFKNLGFMRFPEPVFAGICQNILTVAHFHAC